MHIYFIGIAGAGVSALASLLATEGHRVSGADEAAFPPVTTYLDRLGIPYRNGFDATHLPPDIDLAIVGASAKLGGAENPELVELRRRGVPLFSFPEFLGRHTAGRDNLLVAGSFGKSTLTAMLAYALRCAGRDPGWFIGAIPLDLPSTGQAGGDDEMVIEADEYVVSLEDRRSKLELYHPRHVLLSSIVHDHVNMFPTMASYERPFQALIEANPGLLVAARGYEPIQRLSEGRRVVWYGLSPGAGYGATIHALGETTRFDVLQPSGAAIPLETPLLGLHNVENWVGAAALLLELGLVTADDLAVACAHFRGVARRLDKKTVHSRVPIYEGFGSSFEKARSAIEAIKLHFPARPQVVVFEPHTFSWRNREALAWYDTVFDGAARVLVLPPPAHGASAHAQLTHEEIVARAASAHPSIEPVASGEEAAALLGRTLQGDEVVLLLSSGPLDGLAETLPPAFEAQFG